MRISAKQYAQTLYKLTEGKNEAEIKRSVSNFVEFLARSRRLKMASKIMEQFGALYNKEKGIVEAEVASREKLGEVLAKKLEHYIKDKYRAKEVVINNVIDDKVKGGIVIKVGDEVMDGSVRGKLSELRKVLAS